MRLLGDVRLIESEKLAAPTQCWHEREQALEPTKPD